MVPSMSVVFVFAAMLFIYIGIARKIICDYINIDLTAKNADKKAIILCIFGIIYLAFGLYSLIYLSDISEPLALVIILIAAILFIFIGIVGRIQIPRYHIIISLTAGQAKFLVIIGVVLHVIVYAILFQQNSLPPPPYPIDLNNSTRTIDNKGSSLNSSLSITSIPWGDGNPFEIYYDLKEYGWVSMSNTIIPKELSKRKKIRITYKGSGKPNTIEIKLILNDMVRTTFGVFMNRATVTQGFVTKEISYDQFTCWWPQESCQSLDNKFDLNKIIEIDLAISNKAGDVYGDGNIIIDKYEIIS
ncbi:MAG: hypothetical protein J5U17_06230 [Candidatus Methanoperedens sp.]|nr:hypothetical protein [Candidatus Methanoperedens sp.]